MSSSRRRRIWAALLPILTLAWPTVLEQALHTIVQYVDAAMVGRLGASATAAVGVTTTVSWLVNSPTFALAVGVMAWVSRAIGARQQELARRTAAQAVLIALVLGGGLTVITLSLAPVLPRLLGADPDLWSDASAYFFLVCAPMVFRALTVLSSSCLRASGDTRTPMFVNVLINAVNIVLNFFLIYAPRTVTVFGRPIFLWGAGWGVPGAAAASAVSFLLGGVLMTLALYRSRSVSPRGYSLRPCREILRPCLRISLPVTLERLATCLGHVVFTSLVTPLGTTAFAAHTIALTAEEAFYIPGYGMQTAAATLAGNALGARDEKRLRHTAKTMTLMILVLMTVTGCLLFLGAEWMMRLFTRDPGVVDAGRVILRIVAVSEPIYGVYIILEGIFNGVGDTVMPFYYSMAGMWGVRIFCTFLCVRVFSLGLPAVWCCMVAGNACTGLLLVLRYRRGRWIPEELRHSPAPSPTAVGRQ